MEKQTNHCQKRKLVLKRREVLQVPGVDLGQRKKIVIQNKRSVCLVLKVEQHHQMRGHQETREKDNQGPSPGVKKPNESPDQVQSPDQGLALETSHRRKDISQDHVPKHEIAEELFQNPDRILVLTASHDPGHQGTGSPILVDQEEGLPFLAITDGFHHLLGKEEEVTSDKGPIQGLEGHAQEEVFLGGDSLVHDLCQGDEEEVDLGQDLGEDLNLEADEKDLDPGPSLTQEREDESQLPETKKGVKLEVDLGPSQNQKRELDCWMKSLHQQFLMLTHH